VSTQDSDEGLAHLGKLSGRGQVVVEGGNLEDDRGVAVVQQRSARGEEETKVRINRRHVVPLFFGGLVLFVRIEGLVRGVGILLILF